MPRRQRCRAPLLLASLVIALGLAGCKAKRRANGPSTVSFQPGPAASLTSPPLLAVGPGKTEALLVSIDRRATSVTSYSSSDMGRTWSAPRYVASPLPQGSLSEYDGALFRTSNKAIILANYSTFDDVLRSGGPVSLLRTASSLDSGGSWQVDGSTPVRATPGVSAVGAMDVGRSTLAVVGTSKDLEYPLYVSTDEGSTWKRQDLSVPSPKGYERITVNPPGVFGGPRVAVDGKERVHLLFSEYEINTSDGKKQRGTLYLRMGDGGVVDQAQFTPGDFRTQEGALGEDAANPDVLYQVTSKEAKDQGNDRSQVTYRLEFSASDNGGETWSAPFLLDDHKGIKQFLQVQGDGALVVVAWRDDRTDQPGLYVTTSIDAGVTWSAAERVGDTPATRRYRLAVSGDAVLIVGSIEGPNSFQHKGPFFVTGSKKE